MILIDTSVWVDYFRGIDRELVLEAQKLLDEDQVALAAPVKIEILGGSSTRDLPRLRRLLTALPLLVPSGSTFDLMDVWTEKAVAKGQRFGVADLLIAALAAESHNSVWSLDHDFRRMAKLGFVQLYVAD